MEISLDKSHTMEFLGKDPVRCKIVVDNKRLQQVNLSVWVVKFPKQIRFSTKSNKIFSNTGNSKQHF
jgi:hypothetical protein